MMVYATLAGKGATSTVTEEGEKVKINVISNDKYFLCLDLCIDQTRRDAYFVIEKGEKGISGSYKKFYYTTGKQRSANLTS